MTPIIQLSDVLLLGPAPTTVAVGLHAVLLAALANPFANETCDGFARRAHLRDRHQLNRLLRAGRAVDQPRCRIDAP